jgi:hypothetical protein
MKIDTSLMFDPARIASMAASLVEAGIAYAGDGTDDKGYLAQQGKR